MSEKNQHVGIIEQQKKSRRNQKFQEKFKTQKVDIQIKKIYL